MYHILFIHSSVDKHLEIFHFLIMNKVGMNFHVQDFVWIHIFISLGRIPKSGTDDLW